MFPPGRHQAGRNRVARGHEHDRNGGGRSLCCEGRWRAGECGNHRHLAGNEIREQRRKSIVVALRPAIFDDHIASLDISAFAQALAERAQTIRV